MIKNPFFVGGIASFPKIFITFNIREFDFICQKFLSIFNTLVLFLWTLIDIISCNEFTRNETKKKLVGVYVDPLMLTKLWQESWIWYSKPEFLSSTIILIIFLPHFHVKWRELIQMKNLNTCFCFFTFCTYTFTLAQYLDNLPASPLQPRSLASSEDQPQLRPQQEQGWGPSFSGVSQLGTKLWLLY